MALNVLKDSDSLVPKINEYTADYNLKSKQLIVDNPAYSNKDQIGFSLIPGVYWKPRTVTTPSLPEYRDRDPADPDGDPVLISSRAEQNTRWFQRRRAPPRMADFRVGDSKFGLYALTTGFFEGKKLVVRSRAPVIEYYSDREHNFGMQHIYLQFTDEAPALYIVTNVQIRYGDPARPRAFEPPNYFFMKALRTDEYIDVISNVSHELLCRIHIFSSDDERVSGRQSKYEATDTYKFLRWLLLDEAKPGLEFSLMRMLDRQRAQLDPLLEVPNRARAHLGALTALDQLTVDAVAERLGPEIRERVTRTKNTGPSAVIQPTEPEPVAAEKEKEVIDPPPELEPTIVSSSTVSAGDSSRTRVAPYPNDPTDIFHVHPTAASSLMDLGIPTHLIKAGPSVSDVDILFLANLYNGEILALAGLEVDRLINGGALPDWYLQYNKNVFRSFGPGATDFENGYDPSSSEYRTTNLFYDNGDAMINGNRESLFKSYRIYSAKSGEFVDNGAGINIGLDV